MKCLEQPRTEDRFDLDWIEAVPVVHEPTYYVFPETVTASETTCTVTVTDAGPETYNGVFCYAQSPLGLRQNVISAGGEQIYYPHGGWNSVNVPGATFEQRSTSGFANVDRFTKPAQVAFVASGVIVAGGVAIYYGTPYVIAGGSALLTKAQDIYYSLLAWQPSAFLNDLILYYPQSPPARATAAELWYSMSPYAGEFAAGFSKMHTGAPSTWGGFGANYLGGVAADATWNYQPAGGDPCADNK